MNMKVEPTRKRVCSRIDRGGGGGGGGGEGGLTGELKEPKQKIHVGRKGGEMKKGPILNSISRVWVGRASDAIFTHYLV